MHVSVSTIEVHENLVDSVSIVALLDLRVSSSIHCQKMIIYNKRMVYYRLENYYLLLRRILRRGISWKRKITQNFSWYCRNNRSLVVFFITAHAYSMYCTLRPYAENMIREIILSAGYRGVCDTRNVSCAQNNPRKKGILIYLSFFPSFDCFSDKLRSLAERFKRVVMRDVHC